MNQLKVVSNYKSLYNEPMPKDNTMINEVRPVNPERAIDQKLVEKAQKGDKKAFGLLVEKYNKKNSRACFHVWSEISLRLRISFKIPSSRHTEPSIILGAIVLFIHGFIASGLIRQKII